MRSEELFPRTRKRINTELAKIDRERVRNLIAAERDRQDEKWGQQDHSDLYWIGILTEEVGELAREIIEGNPVETRKELVQVAAVAAGWLEAIERRIRDNPPGR